MAHQNINSKYNTSSFEYEWTIVKSLFDSKDIIERTNKALNTLLDNAVMFVHAYCQVHSKDAVKEMRFIFFSDNKHEQGQIGFNEYDTAVKKNHDNLVVAMRQLIDKLNIREKMTMCMNFYKDPNRRLTCRMMFQAMLDIANKNTAHTPYLKYTNNAHINDRVKQVENLLGFKIQEVMEGCWMPNGKMNCQSVNTSFPSLCNLWNPIIFIYGTHIISNPHVKWDGQIGKIMKPYSLKSAQNANPHCKRMTLTDALPPLSSREQRFIFGTQSKISNNARTLPWVPGNCWFDPNPSSIALKVREKYKKYSVANTSGHTLLHIEFCKFFMDRNDPHFMLLMVLACIMWMVPYDHSIHEVMTAAKIAGSYNEYDYTYTSKANVNMLLNKIGAASDI